MVYLEYRKRDKPMFKKETSVKDYMSIVVTHECTRSCRFCIDANRGKKKYIRMVHVRNALKVAKEKGISDILLVGGEPTMHPRILQIAKLVKDRGFNLIVTTNFDRQYVVQELDQYVDSFNISHYDQWRLPDPKCYTADITLSKLLYKGGLDSKEKLDKYIDKYGKHFTLKFSTLSVCNDWTAENYSLPYLNNLPAEKIVLFNEIEGLVYRGHIVKRYDRVVNEKAEQSLKCLVNGELAYHW